VVTQDDDEPSLTLSQVKGIVTRGRWWILVTMCVSATAAIAIAYSLPDRFTSEATLLVVQQQVPQRYVTPTSTLSIADELQAMTQEVLSRKRLLELIEQFGLYPKERRRFAPEQVIALMRKYIDIEPLDSAPGGKDFTAFKISFSADKAVLAQEVTSQLTSLFIQENTNLREEQASTTTSFLAEQVESAKNTLTGQEEHLRDFKMQYLGELPEQQQGNLAILNGAQAQLQNTTSSLERAVQQRAYLESMLAGYQRLASRGVAVLDPSGHGEISRLYDPVQALQADLTRLQATRAQLLTVYTKRYPDVVAIEREISAKQASLESLKAAKADAQASSAAAGEKNQSAPSSPENEEDTAIAQVKGQLEANRLEIESLSRDEKRANATITQYQSRLNLTPVREQQLSGILRDYELSRQEYLDLLGKEQQSQLAMSLEKRQGGQQFRLAESPSLPTLPSSPKRIRISLGGVGGGILLGLVLAVLAEFRSPKLYDEKELSRRFSMPLVVGLPRLLTPRETRLHIWMRSFEWLAGSALIATILAAQCYVYLRH